jgi:hypothetical protein
MVPVQAPEPPVECGTQAGKTDRDPAGLDNRNFRLACTSKQRPAPNSSPVQCARTRRRIGLPAGDRGGWAARRDQDLEPNIRSMFLLLVYWAAAGLCQLEVSPARGLQVLACHFSSASESDGPRPGPGEVANELYTEHSSDNARTASNLRLGGLGSA